MTGGNRQGFLKVSLGESRGGGRSYSITGWAGPGANKKIQLGGIFQQNSQAKMQKKTTLNNLQFLATFPKLLAICAENSFRFSPGPVLVDWIGVEWAPVYDDSR